MSLCTRDVAVAPWAFVALVACGGPRPELPPPTRPLTATDLAAPSAPRPTIEDRQSIPEPAVHVETLDNGLEVWVLERHRWPHVAVAFACRTPPVSSSSLDVGLASLHAEVVSSQSDPRWATGRSGGPLAAWASPMGLVVQVHGTSRELAGATRRLADSMLRPSWSSATIAMRRLEQLDRLRWRRYSAGAAAEDMALQRLLGAGHPYALPPDGLPSLVARADAERLVAYHRRVLDPRRAAVVVVGDTTADAAIAIARASFGRWAASESATDVVGLVPWPTPEAGAALSVVDIGDGGEPQIAWAFRAPAWNAPDRAVFELLTDLLDDALHENLRERLGVTYGAWADYRPLERFGLVTLHTGVAPESVGPALRTIEDALGALRTRPVPSDALAAARAQRIEAVAMEFETVEGATAALADTFIAGERPNWYVAHARRLAGAGPEEVRRAARTWLGPDRGKRAVAGWLGRFRRSLLTAGLRDFDRFVREEDDVRAE